MHIYPLSRIHNTSLVSAYLIVKPFTKKCFVNERLTNRIFRQIIFRPKNISPIKLLTQTTIRQRTFDQQNFSPNKFCPKVRFTHEAFTQTTIRQRTIDPKISPYELFANECCLIIHCNLWPNCFSYIWYLTYVMLYRGHASFTSTVFILH
jgi:hypothetical protein